MSRGERHHTVKHSNEYIAVSKLAALPDESIVRALAPFGVAATPALTASIRQYVDLLLHWNQMVSLTSIIDPVEILQRHFGESMFAARAVPIAGGRLVDVGSGAGFPGLALKLAVPKLEVFLIEANVKKATFLSEVVRMLELTGVKVISRRMEDISELTGNAEFVTCRAVRADKNLMNWILKVLAPGGRAVMWVGPSIAEQLQANRAWKWETAISVPLSTSRVLLSGRPASS